MKTAAREDSYVVAATTADAITKTHASKTNARRPRSVLMLTYRFAPQGGAGALRMSKFAKYLPNFGWWPVIHTVANPHWHVWDEPLAREIPSAVTVYRTRTFEPEATGEHAGQRMLHAASRGLPPGFATKLRQTLGRLRRALRVWLLVPDRQVAWVPWAVLRTLRIVRRHRPGLMFSSSPPHSAQLVGLLVKRITQLPWVVDFRDLWMQSIHRRELYQRSWRRRLEAALERAVVRNADRLITTTEPNREELIRKYGCAEKVVVIPNGYDHADFEQPPAPPSDMDPECFNLTLTGQIEKLIDLRPFLRALGTAAARDQDLARCLRVRMIGADPTRFLDYLRELRLKTRVEYLPYMAHRQALQYVRASSALLLFQIPDPISSGTKLSVKLFEYFAAGLPILAITSADSITAALISEAGAGIQVRPDDEEGIVTAVSDLFQRWRAGERRTHPPVEFLARFERQHLTACLARLLDDVDRHTKVPLAHAATSAQRESGRYAA